MNQPAADLNLLFGILALQNNFIVKPANIMLGKYGETLVVDWGLAKATGASEAPPSIERESPLRAPAAAEIAGTQVGSTIGTPAYMSPEQAAGRLDLIGERSDIYSLGATLYSLLTGQSPQTSRETEEVLARVARGEFPRPRSIKGDIPKPLEAICLKALRETLILVKLPIDERTSVRLLIDGERKTLGPKELLVFPLEPGMHTIEILRRGHLPIKEVLVLERHQQKLFKPQWKRIESSPDSKLKPQAPS